jgi:hypothetical protein
VQGTSSGLLKLFALHTLSKEIPKNIGDKRAAGIKTEMNTEYQLHACGCYIRAAGRLVAVWDLDATAD